MMNNQSHFVNSTSTDHIQSYARLLGVLACLWALTALTIGIARIDMGIFNIWIAILIASVKASLVLLFFMHLKNESLLLKITFIGTILCLVIFIGFIFWDISFR